MIYDGVTRATRIAKLAPGVKIPVQLIGKFSTAGADFPTIGDVLP